MFSTLYTYQLLKLFLLYLRAVPFCWNKAAGAYLLVLCLGEVVMCTRERAALLPVLFKSSTASPCHTWHLTRSGWASAPPLRCTLLRALAMGNSNQQLTMPVLSASQKGVWPCSWVSLHTWSSCEQCRQTAFLSEQGCVALKLCLSSQPEPAASQISVMKVERRKPR